jgi:hypothetical protein
MCLSSRLTRKAQKEAVAKLPEWVTVWKVYENRSSQCDSWVGAHYGPGDEKGGVYVAHKKDVATDKGQPYKTGFHAYATKHGARSWMFTESEVVVECNVKRSWITSIGAQEYTGRSKVYVTSKIKIPSPKQYFKTHK